VTNPFVGLKPQTNNPFAGLKSPASAIVVEPPPTGAIRGTYNFAANLGRLAFVVSTSPFRSREENESNETLRMAGEALNKLPQRFIEANATIWKQVYDTSNAIIDAAKLSNATVGAARSGMQQHQKEAVKLGDEFELEHPQVLAFEQALVGNPLGTAGEVVRSIPSLPAMMVDMLVNKPHEAVTGLKLTEDELRPLTDDEGRLAAQTTIGNVAAIGAYKAIKAASTFAVERAAARPIIASMESGNFAKAALVEPALSPRMRSIVSEVVSDVAAGTAQAGIAAAGEEDIYTQMISGLMFAPIGLVTGMFGVKTGLAENLKAQAAEIAYLQLAKATDEMSFKDIAGIPMAAVTGATLPRVVVDGKIQVNTKRYGIIPNIDEPTLKATVEGLRPTQYSVHKNPDGTNSLLYIGSDVKPHTRKFAQKEFERSGLVHDDLRYSTSYNGQEYIVLGQTPDTVTLMTARGRTFDVPRAEIRSIANNVVEYPKPTELDSLYEVFKKKFDPTKPYAPQIAQFAAEINRGNDAIIFKNEFGKRYNAELDNATPESKVEAQFMQTMLDNALNSVHKDGAERFVEAGAKLRAEATSNNIWIEETNGGYALRDIDSGNILATVRTYADASFMINALGQNPKKNAGLAESLLIGEIRDIPSNATQIHDRLQQPVNFTVEKGTNRFDKFRSKLQDWVNVIDTHPRITSFEGFVGAMDSLYGTQFRGQYYFETQQAARKAKSTLTEVRKSPLYAAVENLTREVLKGANGESRLELVTAYIETLSRDEMLMHGGLMPKWKVGQESIAIADAAFKKGVDLRNVYRWRRQLLYIENQFKMLYRRKGEEAAGIWLEQSRNLPQYVDDYTALSQDHLAQVEKVQIEYLKDPKYVAAINEHNALAQRLSNGKLREFAEISEMLNELAPGKEGANAMYAASRLWDTLVDPNANITRADFARKHNLTPTELKLAELTSKAYALYGDKFGVQTDSRLVGYINHYRNWGDPLDPTFTDQLAAGIQDQGVRRFVSTMFRTGEVANYVRNPLHALDAYVRTGVKATELMPVLDAWAEPSSAMLEKIRDHDARKLMAERIDGYEGALLGRPELAEKAAREVYAKVLEGHGLDPAEIAKLMESKSALDTVTNVTSASLLGARPIMALRDLTDVTVKYYSLHGKDRVKSMLGYLNKIDANTYKALVESGAIIDSEFRDLYNASTAPIKPSKINQLSAQAADAAFKTSYQPQMHRKVQAAVYLDARKNAISVVNDLITGKIDKQKGYAKLFMNSWDQGTFQHFDDLIASGQAEKAVHFLATSEAQRIAGISGMGNAPQGAGTFIGRVFNQLGSWTISNRSVYGRMLTRGTPAESRGVMRRYLISQAAIATAGAVTGFNLSTWMMTPISFVFTGGPLIDASETIRAAGTALAGGSEAQMNYASNQVKQAMFLPVPFGYAARDVYRAYQLGINGQDFGMMRPAWALLGGSVKEGERSWMDMFLGAYPTPPDDGTNLNSAASRGLASFLSP
jgi:hypothetical protein